MYQLTYFKRAKVTESGGVAYILWPGPQGELTSDNQSLPEVKGRTVFKHELWDFNYMFFKAAFPWNLSFFKKKKKENQFHLAWLLYTAHRIL